MNHMNIEHAPERIQELLVERETIARRLGEAATTMCQANEAYHGLIVEMLQMNQRIREEEMNQ
jgi:hypothetical protein